MSASKPMSMKNRKDRPGKQERLAYLSHKRKRALGRFRTELSPEEYLHLGVNADEGADVQILYSSAHGSVFINLPLDLARQFHKRFGRAIKEREEELYYLT